MTKPLRQSVYLLRCDESGSPGLLRMVSKVGCIWVRAERLTGMHGPTENPTGDTREQS